MNQAKQKMLERVRAILAKTVANGCTEEEALAALEKARELMAAYDIEESELGITKQQEGATVRTTTENDPYRVRQRLATGVALFTRTRVWRNRQEAIVFCGLESEVEFASWLLDMLQTFLLRELRAYQAQRRSQGLGCPRIIGGSFVCGCANRIFARLKDLAPKDEPATAAGNALVVSRKALITEAMAKAGIRVNKGRRSSIRTDQDAWNAGYRAGDSACFSRPVTSGGHLMLTSR